MVFFEHYGRDPYRENRFRQVVMSLLLLAAAVLLFPFTLLAALWLAMGELFRGRRLLAH